MTKLAETCACGAQFSIHDTYHAPKYAYDELEKWRKEHPCSLRPGYIGDQLVTIRVHPDVAEDGTISRDEG